MTAGSKKSGTFGVEGTYSIRTWNGSDDRAHKAWNPYDLTRTNAVFRATYAVRKATGVRTKRGCPAYRVQYAPEIPEVDLKLLAKLTDKIRDHSFNVAVSIAEGVQTAEFVAGLSVGVLQFFHAVRRGDPGGVARAFTAMVQGAGSLKKSKGKLPRFGYKAQKAMNSGDISGTILATQYAWGPLLSDIFAAIDAYETLRKEKPRSITTRVSGQGPLYEGNVSSNPTYNVVWGQWQKTMSYRVIFSEQLGIYDSLGLTNPALVIWEKVPFSFVFDWFVPVGTWLDCLGVLPKLSLRYCKNTADVFEAKLRGPCWVNPADPGYDFVDGYCECSRIATKRTIGTVLQIPFPRLKSVDKVFSLAHIRNAAALFHRATRT